MALLVLPASIALAALSLIAAARMDQAALVVIAFAACAAAGAAAGVATLPRRPWRRPRRHAPLVARGGGVGPLAICGGAVALTALAVVAVRLLNAPPQVAIALAGGTLVGSAAAFALPANALRAPKRLTTPVKHIELAPYGGRRLLTAAVLLGIVCVALIVRFWHFNDVGYNSDEAVYAGQGAGIAHDAQLAPYFPVFRAHPLLFQSIVAIGYELHQGDWFGRAAAIVFGALCVLATFELGRLLYGVRVGLIAAGVLAFMPYHVVVAARCCWTGRRRSSRRSRSAC